jgi:drug/metabolite transporter (DMT)-like permease
MWPWLVLVGVTALSAHYCMARAFAHADAIVVVPMDFLRLPLVALIGLLFYDEPLDLWVLLGAAIIFAGIIFNVITERKPKV